LPSASNAVVHHVLDLESPVRHRREQVPEELRQRLGAAHLDARCQEVVDRAVAPERYGSERSRSPKIPPNTSATTSLGVRVAVI
jgi:hypothetical protein